jgi:hypothetical protein
VFFPAADTAAIATGGSERMRVDSSGNLGLGVTPSAWQSSSKAYELGSAGTAQASWQITSSGYMDISRNAYVASGGTSTYKYNGYAQQYRQDPNGLHSWSVAPSGTAGNAITFTQVLSVDRAKTLALEGASTQTGTGITFPATQSASSNANTLDDYEEGTWTPTLKEGTNTLTAGTNGGYYTKIGNQVTVWINIQDINKSGSGNLSITGLPFSANAANDRFISGAIAFNRIDIPAGIGSPYANIPNYSSLPTTLYLFWNTDGNTNGQQWTAADLADNTSADIAFTLTYFV